MTLPANPIAYFEIPVRDLARAVAFYRTLFGYTFEHAVVDDNEMAFFQYAEDQPRASGALAHGASYVPGKTGPRLYFTVTDIAQTLQKAQQAGAAVLYPETAVGDFYSVAEIEDSEDKCIALHAKARSI